MNLGKVSKFALHVIFVIKLMKRHNTSSLTMKLFIIAMKRVEKISYVFFVMKLSNINVI